MSGPRPRLYLVTPPLAEVGPFLPALEAALDGGPVACLRLRMAGEEEDALRRAADMIREAAHARDIALVLTDHYRLAKPLGLDGVHLENPRIAVREARKALGDDMIVGAFCGAARHQGMVAAEAGADYVALGPVTRTALGGGEVAEPDLFAWWAEMIETPVVAEGGVTLENAAALAAHADFLAVSEAVWRHQDGPGAAVAAFAAILADTAPA